MLKKVRIRGKLCSQNLLKPDIFEQFGEMRYSKWSVCDAVGYLRWDVSVNELIKRRLQTELGVFLVEESGFRYWVWFPRISLAELVSWWRRQESVSEFAVGLDSPYRLPGDIYQTETEEGYDDWIVGFRNPVFSKAWINSESDTYLYTNEKEFVVDKAFPVNSIERETARLEAFLQKGRVGTPLFGI